MSAVSGFFRHSPPSVSISPWPSASVSVPRHVVVEQEPGEVPWRVLATIEVALRPDPTSRQIESAGLRRIFAEAGGWKLTEPAAELVDGWITAVISWWPTTAPEPSAWRPLAALVAAVLAHEEITDHLVCHAGTASPSKAA